MRSRTPFWMIAAACSLAVVGLSFTFGATGVAFAKGKPDRGGGGGGNTEIRLARILFVDQSGIRWDGQASCSDPDPEVDEVWDYWDHRDPVLTLDPACEPFACRIDVSGGGRVKFFTTDIRDRWLTLDFRPTPDFPDDGNGPDIDANVYPGTANSPEIHTNTYVDNVKATVTLDSMFKKNATRQPLDLTIRKFNPVGGGWEPAGWSLHSVFDLYIVNDPNDKDVRTLQTRDPGTDEHDAAIFELWHNGETVGTYYFPLTWEIRIVPAP